MKVLNQNLQLLDVVGCKTIIFPTHARYHSKKENNETGECDEK